MQTYGYNGKLLYIDLNSRTSRIEMPSEKWYRIMGGGGLMGASLLFMHTKSHIDAFEPENMLIFASSVIAGSDAPGLARFSVITKSPLSNGIAEARCEGGFGIHLKASGYDAIIIYGRSNSPVSLIIENGTARIEPADEIWGSSTLDTAEYYSGSLGISLDSVTAIGQAGENLIRYADIVAGGANHAARLGTGAVMGSKNLKAVAVKGGTVPPAADPKSLLSIRAYYEEQMTTNVLSMWQKDVPGFSASADLFDFDTAYIGTDNYRSDLNVFSSSFVRENYKKYYLGENECPSCPNDCMKYIGVKKNEKTESCIHQEVTGSLGANLGNTNLTIVLAGNRLCNLYGIDPVSMGFSISFLFECFENGLISKEDTNGLELRFGNEDVILPLIEMTARREGIGKMLGEGVMRAAKSIGIQAEYYAMHVKGVEMVSFEPRTQTNLAMGYATAPIGPRYDICEHDWDFDVISGWEHTMELSNSLGILERIPMQELSKRKVKNFYALNTLWSACDALNLCIFASAPTRILDLERISQLINAVTGWKTSSYEFMRFGMRRNTLMRPYNLREGFTADDDILPDRFYGEPVSFGRLKGVCLDLGTFIEIRNLWYNICGWDENGVPRESTLYDLELEEFI